MCAAPEAALKESKTKLENEIDQCESRDRALEARLEMAQANCDDALERCSVCVCGWVVGLDHLVCLLACWLDGWRIVGSVHANIGECMRLCTCVLCVWTMHVWTKCLWTVYVCMDVDCSVYMDDVCCVRACACVHAHVDVPFCEFHTCICTHSAHAHRLAMLEEEYQNEKTRFQETEQRLRDEMRDLASEVAALRLRLEGQTLLGEQGGGAGGGAGRGGDGGGGAGGAGGASGQGARDGGGGGGEATEGQTEKREKTINSYGSDGAGNSRAGAEEDKEGDGRGHESVQGAHVGGGGVETRGRDGTGVVGEGERESKLRVGGAGPVQNHGLGEDGGRGVEEAGSVHELLDKVQGLHSRLVDCRSRVGSLLT